MLWIHFLDKYFQRIKHRQITQIKFSFGAFLHLLGDLWIRPYTDPKSFNSWCGSENSGCIEAKALKFGPVTTKERTVKEFLKGRREGGRRKKRLYQPGRSGGEDSERHLT